MLKEILAFLDSGDGDEAFIDDALAFARFHEARLTLVLLSAIPTPDYGITLGPPYVALSAYLEASETKRAALAELAKKEGVEIRELIEVSEVLLDRSPTQARYADLILFGPGCGGEDWPLRRRVFENVVFASGRPVLVLPTGWKPRAFARATLGWNASREATRALGDAMPLLEPGADIQVVTVAANPSAKGHGEEPGADIARYLGRHGFAVEVDNQKAEGRPHSAVLVQSADAHRSDLLILGATARSRLRELLLGGVTQELLAGATLPILFSA